MRLANCITSNTDARHAQIFLCYLWVHSVHPLALETSLTAPRLLFSASSMKRCLASCSLSSRLYSLEEFVELKKQANLPVAPRSERLLPYCEWQSTRSHHADDAEVQTALGAYGHEMCKPTRLLTDLPRGTRLRRKLTEKVREQVKARPVRCECCPGTWNPCPISIFCLPTQRKSKWQYLKKDAKGKVAGGRDLHHSATYPARFCDAIFAVSRFICCASHCLWPSVLAHVAHAHQGLASTRPGGDSPPNGCANVSPLSPRAGCGKYRGCAKTLAMPGHQLPASDRIHTFQYCMQQFVQDVQDCHE